MLNMHTSQVFKVLSESKLKLVTLLMAGHKKHSNPWPAHLLPRADVKLLSSIIHPNYKVVSSYSHQTTFTHNAFFKSLTSLLVHNNSIFPSSPFATAKLHLIIPLQQSFPSYLVYTNPTCSLATPHTLWDATVMTVNWVFIA